MPRYIIGGGGGGSGGGTLTPSRAFVLPASGSRIKTAGDVEYVGDDGISVSGNSQRRRLTISGARLQSLALSTYIDVKQRAAVDDIHGGLSALATGQPLDAVPTDLNVTAGIGKLMIVINAGSDVSGSITVTGTSVDRETGTETASDTDTLTVDAVTTDASDTDASGNARYSFTGAYITTKWFKGAVVLSTADLTLTDVDVYQVAFEQVNDLDAYKIDTFDVTALATNTSAWLYGYLYALVVSGDKCDITREASIGLPAADVSANLYYRLRRGNIGKLMNGSTDGFWVTLFLGPLVNTYWEDINVKVWVLQGAVD